MKKYQFLISVLIIFLMLLLFIILSAKFNISINGGLINIKFNSNNNLKIEELTKTYLARGELDKAENYIAQLKANNELEKFLKYKGIESQIKGKLDFAESLYLEYLKINKELNKKEGTADAYLRLGLLYQERGLLDKACDYWQESLSLNIKDSESLEFLKRLINKECNIRKKQI